METQWSSEDWADTVFHWSPLTLCLSANRTHTFTHSVTRWRGVPHTLNMDMGRERLTRGLLLRLGILLTAVCVCVHVYLETAWRGAPAALASGHPTQVSQHWGQRGRTKQAVEQERSIKRRVSYVRTLKKDSRARRRNEDREDPSPPCCPPPRPRRKVCLIFHQLESLIAVIKILVKLSDPESVQQQTKRLNGELSLHLGESVT